MRKLATLIAIALVALVAVAACGGDGPSATSTTSQEQAIQTLCLKVEQSYPEIEEEFSLPIAETVQRILAGPGLKVVAEGTPCDAALVVALTGEPIGANYSRGGFCYTGAKFNGEMTLTMSERAPLTVPISGRKSTLSVTWGCPGEAGAPFGRVLPGAVLDGLADLSLASDWPPLPVFVRALGDQDEDVREAAAEALGKIGPDAVPALIQALQDKESWVRMRASGALETITGQDFGEDADRWLQWWEEQQ